MNKLDTIFFIVVVIFSLLLLGTIMRCGRVF